MAAAALTRVLENTKTLGPVELGTPLICAYAFQRDSDTVLAIWSRDNTTRTITIKIPAPTTRLTHIDFMGNGSEQIVASDQTITLTIDQYPRYLIGKIQATKTLQ